jgi:citryl-CoA lyase
MATFWNTSLSKVTKNKILIRGYRIDELMEHCSFGDVIYLTFVGELPEGNQGRMLETIIVSSTDHSLLAPSVNSTRFVASGGVPLQAGVAAGLISLGDHHGGAVEKCAELLQEAVEIGTEAGDIVRAYRERHERIPGFGHPIHDKDPRTVQLIQKARGWNLDGKHLALAEGIGNELGKPMNVDGAISGIISDLGISWRYGKAFFVISRAVGLSAHYVEEVTRERPFRAVDLDDVTYDGPPERDLPESFKSLP